MTEKTSLLSQGKHGFTLTEIAIVLGIMGLILGAIWTASSQISNSQKVSKAVHDVLDIVSGVQSLYPSGQISGGAQHLTPELINGGQITPDIIGSCVGQPFGGHAGSAGCALDPWGWQIAVDTQFGGAPYTLPSQPNRFEIFFPFLTQTQCSAFTAAIIGQAIPNGLVEITGDTIAPQAVTSATSATAFSGCSSTVVLQFQL